ncbi:MAG TPA: CopG family transcriptional regulator [Thermoanaerobaculia bacterium]|nr:CopG family transcriptional regulator [Thermoanaerobaculia bacterium]
MKRTTIHLEADLEVLLKLEAKRQKVPMAEVIRAALRNHLSHGTRPLPPGVRGFESGQTDTAEKAEEILRGSRFGQD